MRLFNHFRTLRRQTVRNKLNIIIGLVILVLIFGLLNFWFGMRVMSGIRAYVNGEGLWSKSQKRSVIQLARYARTHDGSYYQKFLDNIDVPLGDRRARIEMDKPSPDMEVVQSAFIQGGNHPDDVKDLYFLYRNFKNIGYMKSAIQIWKEGDQEIKNLLDIGGKIHALLSEPLPAGTGAARARQAEVLALLDEVHEIDARLTVLENRFSESFGEGSRWISKTLTTATLITTILLGALSLIVAIMISRAIVRLDRQKSEFVSLASHQLRTPLTAMNWSSETLLAGSADNLTAAQKKSVERLHDSGQKMAALVGDLLRVSSLELGTYRSEQKDVDVTNLIKSSVRDQQAKIDQKHIALTTSIEPGIPAVKTDEQLLSIILQNLLSNSVKYSREDGFVDVNVKIQKGHLLITIADNGIGIPESQQPQIFNKLFRAENAVKHDSNEGTGLGLYIARAMVRRLGGKIWFDSAENKGSVFYVKIPV